MNDLEWSAERLQGTAITTLITTVFAAIWGLNGGLALAGAGRAVALVAVAAITLGCLALVLSFWRAAPRFPHAANLQPNPFRTRAYGLSVLAMVVAIPVSARLLVFAGRPDATMAAVVAIVGLHFFGLVPAFRAWIFAAIAGALVLLALASVLLVGPDARPAVLGLGTALILWTSLVPIAATTLQRIGRARA